MFERSKLKTKISRNEINVLLFLFISYSNTKAPTTHRLQNLQHNLLLRQQNLLLTQYNTKHYGDNNSMVTTQPTIELDSDRDGFKNRIHVC